MSNIPKAYSWLEKETGPRMLMQAIALLGTVEFSGSANNPVIMTWAEEVGLEKIYTNDAIAWCGLGMSICAKRSGWDYLPGHNPLWAANWLLWGNDAYKQPISPGPSLGDVGVWKRSGGNHVGIIICDDEKNFHVIGFNQSDNVTIAKKPMSRKDPKTPFLGARRAPWRLAQPYNVRRVIVADNGTPISTKES